MWKSIWRSLSNERGQEPSSPDGGSPVDNSSSSDTPERASENDNWGVREPYDAVTPDVADSTPVPMESETQVSAPQGDVQPPATDEESFGGDLNLDPESFSPENKEIFKRMQAGYTKKMQKFKGYEGHLRNMERFYNDRDFAEQTLKQWAQKNGYSIVPSQFANNQPATPQQGDAQTNALQAKLVQTLKSKLPSEAQWLADGQASAIFEVMKEVLGPVLSEFQGFKTQKEENEWKNLESEYETTEQEFAKKYPGWEAHEEDMSKMLAFLNDTKAYRHPQYGTKHELLFKLVTGNASAIKQVTDRVAQAGRNRVPSSAPGKKGGSGFASVQDEVAATTDKKDAFALAATKALQQMRRKR